MPDSNETIGDKRNFGTELRDARGDKPEQRRILREMVIESADVDEDAARKVFETFDDAGLVIVTEEGWQRGVEAQRSLQTLGALADELYSRD